MKGKHASRWIMGGSESLGLLGTAFSGDHHGNTGWLRVARFGISFLILWYGMAWQIVTAGEDR